MKLIIACHILSQYDAIGCDVMAMQRVLREALSHIPCFLYAQENKNKNVPILSKDMFLSHIGDKNNILILHHGGFWAEADELLQKAKCRIVFRYHNVTPPSFFDPYSESHVYFTQKGAQQTQQYIKNFPAALWLCDSSYNTEEISAVPAKNISIVPPFMGMEEWGNASPKEEILQELLCGAQINLLFVGRIVPNKGYMFLLESLRHYVANFGEDVMLRIIGKWDDQLEGYNQALHQKVVEYNLSDNVQWIGECNDETLVSYYLASDIFVCGSEHEGFCVPIVEAQYFGLPVIAVDSAAVPSTVGENQVLLERNPATFAAAIHVLAGSVRHRQFLRAAGRDNYRKNFQPSVLAEAFISFLKNSGMVNV